MPWLAAQWDHNPSIARKHDINAAPLGRGNILVPQAVPFVKIFTSQTIGNPIEGSMHCTVHAPLAVVDVCLDLRMLSSMSYVEATLIVFI